MLLLPLFVLMLFGCLVQQQQRQSGVRRALLSGLVVVLAVSVGLGLWPGFPVWLLAEVPQYGCHPSWRWQLSLNKVSLALLLLILLRGIWQRSAGQIRELLALTVLGITAILALAYFSGFIGWQPAAPNFWPLWLLAHLFCTVLAEELLFRGFIQAELERAWRCRYSAISALLVSSLLFGLAHVAGGWLYMLLATCAGLVYGSLWQRSHNLCWPILAHWGLNAVHFIGFSYPYSNGQSCG